MNQETSKRSGPSSEKLARSLDGPATDGSLLSPDVDPCAIGVLYQWGLFVCILAASGLMLALPGGIHLLGRFQWLHLFTDGDDVRLATVDVRRVHGQLRVANRTGCSLSPLEDLCGWFLVSATMLA